MYVCVSNNNKEDVMNLRNMKGTQKKLKGGKRRDK